MNNAVNYGRGYVVERRVAQRRAAPAWLVMICRLILWLSCEEVRGALRAMLALGAVAAMAVFAGAMSFGAVPLGYGVVICVSLGIMALFATCDF